LPQQLQQLIRIPVQPVDFVRQRLHTDHCDTEAPSNAQDGD
jgi:hypothetical protein